MTAPPPNPRRPSSRRAFTLTEILIALAMTAFLLIGISRIFAITSQTIGTGQALSAAMRTQRAIQQTISSDVLGVIPTSSQLRPYSGITPLNDNAGENAGMPFLAITNFRVATYANQAAYNADSIHPSDVTSVINATDYRLRSEAIRGIDSNNDGTEAATSISSAGGERVPIFSYGDRNFRCDTICFFTRGQLQSQTGVSTLASGISTTFQSEVSSGEGFVWYGHMRVFNGTPTRLDYASTYGAPGEWLTQTSNSGPQPQGPLPNRNNRFAEDFVLGRMQLTLVDPVDHDQRTGSSTPTAAQGGADRKFAEDNTVVSSGDPSKPVIFLQRNWWDPLGDHLSARPIPSPFTINDSVVLYKPDSNTSLVGANRTLYTDDRTLNDPARKSSVAFQALGARTDIAGVSSQNSRRRIRFLQEYDVTKPPNPSSEQEWWENLLTTWNRRYWVNPFVSTTTFDPAQPNINAKSIAQRQQMVAQGVSQFIVEFAGDFLTQSVLPDANFGQVTAETPDGVTDFVAIPTSVANSYRQETRWYGLPRDVDGDGHIYTTIAARTSRDVIPVSIFAQIFVPASVRLPFERLPLTPTRLPTTPATVLPFGNNDYAMNVDEPAGATDPGPSSYVCVWGASDFERTYPIPNPSNPLKPFMIEGAVPQLIRFVIDVRDTTNHMKDALTQELVYPVPNDGKTTLK